MRKFLSGLLFVISVTCYSQNFDLGISSGYFSFDHYFGGKTVGSLNICSFRAIDTNTGLGISTYILPAFTDIDFDDNNDSDYIMNDFFALEFNWEPLYKPGSFWGAGLFFQLNNYFPTENQFFWKSGLRFDFRAPLWDLIYPLVTIEAGYQWEKGFYCGIKIDPIVILIIAGISFVEENKNPMPDDYGPAYNHDH